MKSSQSITSVSLITLILIVMSTPSFAKNPHHSSIAWAKVKRVEPITRMIEHRVPEKNCWREEVEYDTYSSDNSSYTSTIVGGIIGGAIGNAVGHKKKNKRYGTAIGAVLGASIGNDLGRKHHRTEPVKQYRTERRCEHSDHVNYEEQIVGYHVWYRYHGETYKTRMSHKPGKKIKVRVSVKPF